MWYINIAICLFVKYCNCKIPDEINSNFVKEFNLEPIVCPSCRSSVLHWHQPLQLLPSIRLVRRSRQLDTDCHCLESTIGSGIVNLETFVEFLSIPWLRLLHKSRCYFQSRFN